MYYRVVYALLLLGLFTLRPVTTQADTVEGSGSISITATVPTITPEETVTTVVIDGFAYPGTEVTIKQDGEIISTASADSQGAFSTTIADVEPGIRTYALRSEDQEGRRGPTSNVSVSVTEGTTVTISGVFLGPTIDFSDHKITLDDTTTVLGVTAVESAVTLYITAENDRQTTYNKEANQQGIYTKSILASDLGEGRFTAHSRSVATDGTISDSSKTVTLNISNSDETSVCDLALDSDINCDGEVDLVDFSILLFWWNQKRPDNSRADINGDGFVDIIDFSIMLFYWTA